MKFTRVCGGSAHSLQPVMLGRRQRETESSAEPSRVLPLVVAHCLRYEQVALSFRNYFVGWIVKISNFSCREVVGGMPQFGVFFAALAQTMKAIHYPSSEV